MPAIILALNGELEVKEVVEVAEPVVFALAAMRSATLRDVGERMARCVAKNNPWESTLRWRSSKAESIEAATLVGM